MSPEWPVSLGEFRIVSASTPGSDVENAATNPAKRRCELARRRWTGARRCLEIGVQVAVPHVDVVIYVR